MKYRIEIDKDSAAIVQRMSITELLQTVCCAQANPTQEQFPIKTQAVFLHRGTRDDARRAVGLINEGREQPAVILADIECGSADALKGYAAFPSMYALGRTADPQLAYKIGCTAARDALESGYRWSLAPCVDLPLSPDAPMASLRTAGEQPQQIIDICGAYLRGMQDGGVAATLKHFPGDGCVYDQHLTTPENPLSAEQWYDSYGRIYSELINEGVAAIMPGHIALPFYDRADERTGLYPPATLSSRVMSDLLRGELGFEGLIVSDAVNMGGFCGYMNYYRACARFLECGGDMLLFADPDEQFVAQLTALIECGELSLETLRKRALRVLCFLRQLRQSQPRVECNYDAAALSDEVVRRSVETVRDRRCALPLQLQPTDRVLHLTISNNEHEIAERINEMLSRHCEVEWRRNPAPWSLFYELQSGRYAAVVCTVGNPTEYGTNVVRLHGAPARAMMTGWTKLDTPVCFVNCFHPYFGREYAAQTDTLINTYGAAAATPDAVERLLFGR